MITTVQLFQRVSSVKKRIHSITGKNGFVTATKLGTTDNFLFGATKNIAAAAKRFVDRT